MNEVFYGNTISTWIVAAGIAAAVALALYGIRYFITCRLSKLAERTETKIDDMLLEVLGSSYFRVRLSDQRRQAGRGRGSPT
mgnify:CR=1 FL=1